MHTRTITRRRFLAASAVLLGFLAMPQGGLPNDVRECVLENSALSLSLSIGGDGIAARTLENKLSSQRISLPTEEFLFEFDDGGKLSSRGLTARLQTESADLVELLFSDPSGMEVRVQHRLAPQADYTRKQISLRQKSGPARRLVRTELENWQGVVRPWTTLREDRLPYGSHPVFCESLWAGVEFVTAFNQIGPEGFSLCSRPGRRLIGADWVELRSTVIGVAKPGGVRDAFLRYIDDIRLAPPRVLACYNSWWTLPKVVKQQDNLALIQELKAAMFDRHGVFFDIITTDMGWSNPRSIWEIDRSILPRGFDDIRAVVEPAGGGLGIWMSPSEVYPPVCDYDWAQKAGYTVLRPERENVPGQPPLGRSPGLSLADSKYRIEAKQQLQRLIRENGLRHIKYDGFWALERHAHHDLAPGDDSVEPLAEHSLELLQASKEANPQLVTEPTYMNSIANYISPWILKYSDTVWANGEDCVVGIGPAPPAQERGVEKRVVEERADHRVRAGVLGHGSAAGKLRHGPFAGRVSRTGASAEPLRRIDRRPPGQPGRKELRGAYRLLQLDRPSRTLRERVVLVSCRCRPWISSRAVSGHGREFQAAARTMGLGRSQSGEQHPVNGGPL